LDVYAWIAAVAGDNNVHMHDILLMPMQLTMPRLRQQFADAGYDVSVKFGTLDSSRRLFDYILKQVGTEVATYVALIMNLTVKPYGRFGLNVAHAMLPRRWTFRDDPPSPMAFTGHVWLMEVEDVIIPVKVLRVVAPLEDALICLTKSCALEDEDQIFGQLVANNGDKKWSHAKIKRHGMLFLVLMTVTDPLQVLDQVWHLYEHMDEEDVAFIARFRQKLVSRIWPSAGHCFKDLIAIHKQWVQPVPPNQAIGSELSRLVCRIIRHELIGPVVVAIDAMASFFQLENDRELLGLFAFACVTSELGSHSLLRMAKYDTVQYAKILDAAMSVWRDEHEQNRVAYQLWGRDILFECLTDALGKAASEMTMDVLYDSSPGGKVPKVWVDEVLFFAAYDSNKNRYLVGMCKTLMRYGLFDPKSSIFVDQHPDARLYLSEWCAMEQSEGVGELLRYALKIGSPKPRMDVVSHWWTTAEAFAEWKAIELEMSLRG
jgi:hypothetical protein